MIDTLNTSRHTLQSALEQYSDTVSAVTGDYSLGNTVCVFPRTFLDNIDSELRCITSFKTEIRRIESALQKIRNQTSTIVPINTLPPETLTRIFRLVCSGELCCFNDGATLTHGLSTSPEFLSHVCSYWRSLALSSAILWSHVDLVPRHFLTSGLLTRAETFATRSGNYPLDIHIKTIHHLDRSLNAHHDNGLITFCNRTAPRVGSLLLDGADSSGSIYSPLFRGIIANCTPGEFTRLSIPDGITKEPRGFFVADDQEMETVLAEAKGKIEIEANTWSLDIPKRQIEQVLHSIIVLRLDGTYPYWTSQAYHGLVKLYLSRQTESDIPITVSQLAVILRSSPQLCFLHFSLVLTNNDFPFEPVRLNDLEVLQLKSSTHTQQDALLRLISPGPKPLRMLTTFPYDMPTLAEDEHSKFFARSNVTQLHIEVAHPSMQLSKLLGHLPNLRVLTLTLYRLRGLSETPPTLALPPPQLDALHLITPCIDMDVLQWVIETCQVLAITIEEGTRVIMSDSSQTVYQLQEDELMGIFPKIKFVKHRTRLEEEDWS